ncbi:MAG: tetratricopeptide repeat protein [Nitrososphaerales archaeon]|nr:tetratricopeptide repeat protein [Nitrososphaerales archaeon]
MSPASVEEETERLLSKMDEVQLDRYGIVGEYVRFDNDVRNSLKDFKLKIISGFENQKPGRSSFLVWGPPGSGKTFFVQQIAKSLARDVDYREFNLAQTGEAEFRRLLESAEKSSRPCLCFIDEIDSKPLEPWPYEALLPCIEPSKEGKRRICFVLAGSGGSSLDEMKAKIAGRPKGKDLLSRILRGCEFVIPPLGVGDKLLVAATQIVESARERGIVVEEIDKLALYFIAVNPAFSSARQLRGLAVSCVERVPRGEDRVKFDYLFAPGDPENKEFWVAAQSRKVRLAGEYVSVKVGSLMLEREEPGMPLLTKSMRLAILPLANMSPDPADEYFADGMTEELISKLSQMGDLRVIARTSVMRYKGTAKPIREIGRELGVQTIIEGSVRKSGNNLRIAVQLVDTASEEHLWAETYDKEMADIFKVQGDVASNVASALRVAVAAPAPEGRTEETEAFTRYLKGRYFWNRGTIDAFAKALEQFERSIEKDPTYAQAYAGLADTHLLLGRNGYVSPKEAYPRALQFATKAITLDSKLAEPHVALAAIHQEFEWKWDEVEKEFKQAIRLNPSYATAHGWYALFLGHVGRFEEAISEVQRAQELDPLSPRIHCNASEEYLFARQYDKAIEAAERALELDSNYGGAHGYRAFALVEKGMYGDAIKEFQEADRLAGGRATSGRLGHVYGLSGRTAEARKILGELLAGTFQASRKSSILPLPPPPSAAFDIGLIYLGLGDEEKAIDWLNKASDERTPEIIHVKCEPIYDSVRDDPKFRALVTKVGLGE